MGVIRHKVSKHQDPSSNGGVSGIFNPSMISSNSLRVSVRPAPRAAVLDAESATLARHCNLFTDRYLFRLENLLTLHLCRAILQIRSKNAKMVRLTNPQSFFAVK